MNLRRAVALIPLALLLVGLCASMAWSSAIPAELGLTPEVVATALVEPPLVSLGGIDDAAAEYQVGLAAGLWREGRTEEAVQGWATIVKEKPGTVQALKALFRIAGHLGETDVGAAVALYEGATSARPGDAYLLTIARMWEAELFFFPPALNLEEGTGRLQQLADARVGTAEEGLPYLRLAAYYLDNGDVSLGEQYYQTAMTRSPHAWYVPYVAYSRCDDLLERRAGSDSTEEQMITQLVFRELDRALAEADGMEDARIIRKSLLLRGKLDREAGNLDDALVCFERLAAHQPDGEWGANGVLEAAWTAAEMGNSYKVEQYCTALALRLEEATWLRPRQLTLFRSEMERLRERLAEVSGG